jgi:hypothetical protein
MVPLSEASVPDLTLKTPALEVRLVNDVEIVLAVFETSCSVASFPPLEGSPYTSRAGPPDRTTSFPATIFVRATISLDRNVAFSMSRVPAGDASIGIVIIRGGFFKGEKSP